VPRSSPTRNAAIPLLFLLALAIAGCGSKSGSPTTIKTESSTTTAIVVQTGILPTSPPLTVARYRARAGAICKTASRKLNANMLHGSLSQKIVEEIEFAAKTALAASNALARLVPPPRLARLNAQVIADTRALVGNLPLLVDAAKQGIAAYERAYARINTTRSRRLASNEGSLWKKLGVPACNG
jgi:hypothetical protein